MADNKKKVGKDDDIRINVRQAWELAYWTRKFGCTRKELRAAVKAVGPMAVAVLRHLRARQPA